jgi:putative transcriptional regulator
MDEEVIKTARKQIGLFIKDLRKERNVTQEELAESIGVTHATVNKIENGRFNYGIDLFFKISVVLGFKLELISKTEVDNSGRFDLFEYADKATVIDNLYSIRIDFTKGDFNGTQKVKFENDRGISASDLATAMREIGDWLNENYSELI